MFSKTDEQTGPNHAPTRTARPKRTPKAPSQADPALSPEARLQSCAEVNTGFSAEQAQKEALRCLACVDPKCIQACPLHVNIKAFISSIISGDVPGAYETILDNSPFPGICGRVCQHERF